MVSLVLVDDHVMLLETLASALRRRGHIVLATASSHAEGVRLAAELRPDVCLLDRDAEGEDVFALVRTIRQRSSRTRVLLLSDSARDRDVTAARAAGAAGLVLRSASVEAVSIAVTTADQAKGVWPETAAARATSVRLPAQLTPREAQVLELLASGAPTVAIAAALGITVNTARTHVQRVLTKLGVSNRFQAAHLILGADQQGPDAVVRRRRVAGGDAG